MYEGERNRFLSIHKYELNLEDPQSFNEKIVYKKLFDRNPMITLTADKYRMRKYVRDRIGWEAEAHLVPLYAVVDKPEDIPFDILPEEYIIKPNNGAGRWIVVEGIEGLKKYEVNHTRGEYQNLTNAEIIEFCKKWFLDVHGAQWYEWAYQEIEPLIVVEKLLRCSNGNIPSDFRVCMFGGKCHMIYVTTPHQETFNYYDENWDPINIIKPGHGPGAKIGKPKNFNKMIEFAEKLSSGFDFIRADFFIVDDYIYFSELTHYPGAGHGKLPTDIDFELGKHWKIGSGEYDRYN